MSRRRALTLLVALFLLAAGSTSSSRTTLAAEPPLRVLFVGNSYTSVNQLPQMVSSLAKLARGRQVVVGSSLKGGYTLEKHWALDGTRQQLQSGKWDVVVLQEQSQRPFVNPSLMHKHARLLAAEAEKHGARVVFYLTWARQHRPETQTGLNSSYRAIAKEFKATVAPVGPAWALALKDDPQLALHTADKSHPSKLGAYLAACVIYGTLFEKDPTGLPPLPGATKPLATKLQGYAWQAIEAERKLAEE